MRATGSRTSPAASVISLLSAGTAVAVNLDPDAALSTLRYAPRHVAHCSACCSPHSVDEVSVNSSASQLANRIDRFGRHAPRRNCAERSRELHQRRGQSARRIDAAVDPCVTVVADDDDLFGMLAARGSMPVARPDADRHAIVQTHARRLGHRARVGRQQSLGASFYDSGALMIAGSETASARSMRRAPGTDAQPGVRGSPRHDEVVHDAAALDVAVRSPRSLRIDRASSRRRRRRDRNRSGCRRRRAAARSAP